MIDEPKKYQIIKNKKETDSKLVKKNPKAG